MALTRTQSVYGIHSICAYDPDTMLPYGIAKVVGKMSLNLAGEQTSLYGGSNPYPWDVQAGIIKTEGSILLREVPDWSFAAFQGVTATTGAAETGGAVSTITNIYGATVVASTGIASVSVKAGSEADVKNCVYVVKAASATTVDVYALTDVDATRGTDLTYQNDALKITASALTIATGADVDIPNTGLKLTGGAGTIAMTTGHSAQFDSRSINTSSTRATVGASGLTIPNVGLLCAAQKKGNNEIFMLDIMRCQTSGFPFNLQEKAFMETEISFQAFYDTTRDGVYRYIRVDGS